MPRCASIVNYAVFRWSFAVDNLPSLCESAWLAHLKSLCLTSSAKSSQQNEIVVMLVDDSADEAIGGGTLAAARLDGCIRAVTPIGQQHRPAVIFEESVMVNNNQKVELCINSVNNSRRSSFTVGRISCSE